MELKENTVYSKKNDIMFFVIKNTKDNTYFGYHFKSGTPEDDGYNLVEWTKDIDFAEAFDEYEDAENNIDGWVLSITPRDLDEEEALDWQDEERQNYKIVGIKSIKFTE